MTNRELYQLVLAIETDRSLEEYLRALWRLGSRRADTTPTAREVATLLVEALEVEPPTFEPRWLEAYAEYPDTGVESFDDWEQRILFQITDLHRMAETGQLDDPHRFYGITGPSGAGWYNFEVETYLECAVRGTVGGYEAAEVIVLEPSNDGDDDSPVFQLTAGWDLMIGLLECGRCYE